MCFTRSFNSYFAMSLTSFDISRIANLARLELKPDESERMLTQINSFFEIVEKMRAVTVLVSYSQAIGYYPAFGLPPAKSQGLVC